MNTTSMSTATTPHRAWQAWRRWLPTGLLGMTLLGGVSSLAHAVQCGDTLGPGGTIVLEQDLLNCLGNVGLAALTLVGPVTVDLKNHTVSCFDFPPAIPAGPGIALTGKKVKLKNGTIRNCQTGVKLGGQGQHTLTNLTVQNSIESGIVVDSDKNTLSKTIVSGSGFEGFAVDEDANTLTGNTARNNNLSGFNIFGNRNKLTGNTASDNELDGFNILGSSTTLLNNDARGNNLDGFNVLDANQTLRNNTANDNGSNGFNISGNDSILRNNRATDNGRNGFFIFGDGNLVQQNHALDNDENGIVTSSFASDTQILSNTALGHGAPFFDLKEGDLTCDNTWEDNTFNSANQGCIQ